MFTHSLSSIFIGVLAAFASAQQPSNPVKIAKTEFLGYRNASNDQSVRDLGYMGNIGSTYILTFGDGVGTTNAKTRTDSGCAFITARDGAGLPGSDPLSYADVNLRKDLCGGVPQMARFCPELSGETDSSGLGITNIVGLNDTYGALWTLPQQCGSSCVSQGAGLAVVTMKAGTPVCTRPFGVHTWGPDEPSWGQLGAISASDGHIYVYANGPNSSVVLARVPLENAFNLGSYQYWHGTAAGFTSTRIKTADLKTGSPELLGFTAAQGSIYFSNFYNQYIYFDPYFGIFAQTADRPEGPWSSSISVYGPPQIHNLLYTPVIQPKYASADGSQIVLGWSDDNYQGLVRITFTK
ncbi:hypothetical protein B0H17DRAFT_1201362 [Mycena rosella]|uniref:DUF4185 domain-containing protein n=1 Tax=Mycena rosella TaxID=1033263 RepID=A0AAD7GED8_MYCRO|nr:hypothetical protein B0H17DRAFT_1201362 [Mycena rosella]